MRNLHPPGPAERLVDRGQFLNPAGEVETWTMHELPGDRRVVRVESTSGAMWHMAVDDSGAAERVQARLGQGGVRLDVVLTFFPDETLIWRRGGGEPTEAVALPEGYRVVWGPYPGRGLLCLHVDGSPGTIPLVRIVVREDGTDVEVHVGDEAVDLQGQTLSLGGRGDGGERLTLGDNMRVLTYTSPAGAGRELTTDASRVGTGREMTSSSAQGEDA